MKWFLLSRNYIVDFGEVYFIMWDDLLDFVNWGEAEFATPKCASMAYWLF